MSRLVCGVGFNDKTRPCWVDGKIVKEYSLWKDMLRRCFSEECQNKQPTYKGCNVSDNFLNYSFFYDWCQNQVGFGKVDDKGRSWCFPVTIAQQFPLPHLYRWLNFLSHKKKSKTFLCLLFQCDLFALLFSFLE